MTTNRYTLWSDRDPGLPPGCGGARRIRSYSAAVIAGPLQTADYARDLRLRGPEARRLRSSGAELPTGSGGGWTILLEESVLHAGGFDEATMIGQLRHLRELVRRQPPGAIGVIPHGAEHRPWPAESFELWDDRRVVVELASRCLELQEEADVAAYVREFESLATAAVYGQEALTLVVDALAVLDPDA